MRSWLGLLAVLCGCDVVFRLDELPTQPTPEAGSWAQVTSGDNHTCALRLDGTLWCWGQNEAGQLGLGSGAGASSAPTQIGDGKWLTVVAKGGTTCAIKEDHSLWCWGDNQYGQLGDGTKIGKPEPVQISKMGAASIVVGGTHACSLAFDGTAWCWGDNLYGQLGAGDYLAHPNVVEVMPVAQWAYLTLGERHSCALAFDGTAWCWGDNSYGELGIGSFLSQTKPHQVTTQIWVSLSAGTFHTCGVLTDGHFRCWGSNSKGQLATDWASQSSNPVAPDIDDDGWAVIAAGEKNSCAIQTSGTLWCWGGNESGQSGGPPAGDYPKPSQVTGGALQWTDLALGLRQTCGLGNDHNLWCFGLAASSAATVKEPVQVPGKWDQVGAGDSATCAIDAMGALACWGNNASGQLGDSTYKPQSAPKTIAPAMWAALSVGGNMACAIQEGGALYCWGTGAIGDSSIARLIPTPIAAPMLFSSVAVGRTYYEGHSCAIEASTKHLYCWGTGYRYELGTGMAVDQPLPTLATTQTWTSVTAGAAHSCGIGSAGSQCWGENYDGQIGNGNTMAYYQMTPYVVPGSFAQIQAGSDFTCGITGAGAMSCWGYNYYGQLGIGTSMTSYYVPRPVQGTWSEVAPATNHACAIGLDHSLWCWGDNLRGQLGIGTLEPRSAPVQIGGDTSWQHVATGATHSCATRMDESLWCWGDNSFGQLGIGTTDTTNDPTLVP